MIKIVSRCLWWRIHTGWLNSNSRNLQNDLTETARLPTSPADCDLASSLKLDATNRTTYKQRKSRKSLNNLDSVSRAYRQNEIVAENSSRTLKKHWDNYRWYSNNILSYFFKKTYFPLFSKRPNYRVFFGLRYCGECFYSCSTIFKYSS